MTEGALFVCHASYETDRAHCGIDCALAEKPSWQFASAAVVATRESLTTIPGYRDCLNGLVNKLSAISKTPAIPLDFSRSDLVGMTKAIHESVGKQLISSIRTVIVDASVFPKDRLWMVLDYFKRTNSGGNLFVAYTEPLQYSTEIGADGWLSKGVKRLIRVPGFNGHQNPSKRALLVLIVGHEKERMQITIKNLEPHKVVLVGQGWQQHGDATPHFPQLIGKQLGMENAGLVDLTGSIEVGSRDYRATCFAIQSIYEKYKDEYNIIVAGNGTKLQSLGALLACQNNRSLAAVYAEPQVYNARNYSIGTGSSWMLKL